MIGGFLEIEEDLLDALPISIINICRRRAPTVMELKRFSGSYTNISSLMVRTELVALSLVRKNQARIRGTAFLLVVLNVKTCVW